VAPEKALLGLRPKFTEDVHSVYCALFTVLILDEGDSPSDMDSIHPPMQAIARIEYPIGFSLFGKESAGGFRPPDGTCYHKLCGMMLLHRLGSDLAEPAGLHVIYKAAHRHITWNPRVYAEPLDLAPDILFHIAKREERCWHYRRGFRSPVQSLEQIFILKSQHPAIGVVDDLAGCSRECHPYCA